MKKIIIRILKGIWIFLGIIAVYLLVVLLLPYIEISAKKVEAPKTINAYILTNGVHTDIVMPLNTTETNWNNFIPISDTKSKNAEYQYLSVGWGDKGFYLDTPTWADLKISTALNAAFWLGESAMHCTFYNQMKVGEDCKKIALTQEQYLSLIQFVKGKFDLDANGKPILIKTDAVYGMNDSFYEAKGSYSFLDTCNTWTNNALKVAGQKAALWTATDFGIFQHYK